MKNNKAFTLIELLVVVAIIALLIALLLPTLARAKEEAKTTRCQANLHEIAIALASYNAGNNDFMPSLGSNLPAATKGGWAPDWSDSPTHSFLMGWMDQMAIDGDIKEILNQAYVLGGSTGHYPTWGYAIMQCPSHDAQFQWANSNPPTHPTNWQSDDKFLQGYSLAWCARSNWYDTNSGAPWSMQSRDLDPNHIIIGEGNGNMGAQSAYFVPAHMQSSSVSPGNYCYGIYERHRRNNTMGANYLFADSHAEYSQDYGWAQSPFSFKSSINWSAYKGPTILPNGRPNTMMTSRIWAHGASD